MSTSAPTPAAPPPTRSRLAKTTTLAILAAAVILVTIVLPAEYAIDPTGTGRWLGLTDIASPPMTAVETVKTAGAPLVPVPNGPIGEYPAEYTFDVFEITLAPYEYVEYKYRLEQGATMIYAWKADGMLEHDFHGERGAPAGGAAAEESFDKRARREANGSFTAPFAGIHGWYWENPGAEPVKIRLTSAGFYSSATEIRSDRTRRDQPLRALDTLPPANTAVTPAR
jgi:hypothetical protein